MKTNYYNYVVTAICGFTLSISIYAQAPDWTRLMQMNTYGLPDVKVVSSDASNGYIVSTISGPITFAGTDYSNVGSTDMLVTKTNDPGSIEWIKQFNAQTNGIIMPEALKVDESGNVFIAGTFNGTMTIGNVSITSNESYNSFFAKLDHLGNGIWVTPFFSSGIGSSKLALDQSGNAYLISKSSQLAKFNESGILQWVQYYPVRTLQTIAVDGDNLYIGGALQGGTTTFGSIELTSLGGYNTGFLVKGDLNGVYFNSLVVGGSTTGDGSAVGDIVIDNNGNLLITGGFVRNLVLGDITIENDINSYYTFVAKCNENFVFSWANSSSSLTDFYRYIWNYRLFLDNSGHIYQFGMNGCTFQFGNVTINNLPGNQFLIKFNSQGVATNGYSLEFTSYDETCVTQSGNVLTGGDYNYSGNPEYGNFYVSQYNNNLIEDWSYYSSNSLSGTADIYYVKHDQQGNTYLKSRVIGYCNFFGTEINTTSYITVISKHGINGDLLWFEQINDIDANHFGPQFTIDKDNNVLTLGLFDTSLTIGNTTLTSLNYGYEGYVAKFSSDGEFIWAKSMNLNTEITTAITLATDTDGNVIVAGVIAPADNFLVKFNASGDQLWAQSFPMESYYIAIVSTDINNNIYMTSEIHLDGAGIGSINIGNVTLTQTPEDGATVLVKFDPDGNALWANTYGGVSGGFYSDGWPCDIKTDPGGYSYIWGWCPDNATFGVTTLSNPFATFQNWNLFLAKINTSGNVTWANAVYEKKYGFNYGDLLDIDNFGNVYVGGHFRDSISINGTEYFPEGSYDFFAAKYSNAGDFEWLKTIPSNAIIIRALSVNDDDVLSVAGDPGKNSTLGNFNVIPGSGSVSIVATLGNLPIAIHEPESSNISVYPNPANNKLFINNLADGALVSIYNLSGIRVINQQINDGQINIQNLHPGLYTLKILGQAGIVTGKFIKQ